MITLILATRNAHKVHEIRGILGGVFRYLTLNDFPNAPEAIEDLATFAGNATKKAISLATWFLYPLTHRISRPHGFWLTIRGWKWMP
jgi:inosine/xanthosine triphosphate pyrophosphatase family protein